MYEDFLFEGYYALICTDYPNSEEKREKVRPQHVSRLKKLQTEGRLLLAGPFLNHENLSEPIGGLIIVKFDSFQDVQEWVKEEPYVKGGVYKDVQIKAYKDVFAYMPNTRS